MSLINGGVSVKLGVHKAELSVSGIITYLRFSLPVPDLVQTQDVDVGEVHS